ncbi:hypothetical protein [Vibrio sp. WXL210]|uniref:hypothetical protein n=1 Tax=Vibrio sp. WXL210 TaxID=3450709 RepID=UPI003EC711ED
MQKTSVALALSIVLAVSLGCQSTTSSVSASDPVVEAGHPADAVLLKAFATVDKQQAKAKMVTGEGVTVGEQALQVDFDYKAPGQYPRPGVRFYSKGGKYWDWSDKESFVVDVTNPTDVDATITMKAVDKQGLMGGDTHQINFQSIVPAGATKELEMYFDGGEGHWGGQELKTDQIGLIQIFAPDQAKNKQTLIFDNVRIR